MRIASLGTALSAITIFAMTCAPAAFAQEDTVDIEAAVAAADASAGQAVFRMCAGCHTAEEGGATRVGPNLWGIVGRDVASVEGYRYSGAMSAQEGTWTLARLDAYLTAPRREVPGTNMSFAGIRNPTQRINLLAYLDTLRSADPAQTGEEAQAAE